MGERRIALNMATGGTKTLVLTGVLPHIQREGKVLLLMNESTQDKYIESLPSLKARQWVKSKETHNSVIYSILDNLKHLNPSDFKAVVLDEAEYADTKPYQGVLERFKDTPLIGFASTGRKHLSQVFSTVLDDTKWLCDIRFSSVSVPLDLTNLTPPDVVLDMSHDISFVVDTEEVNEAIYNVWKEQTSKYGYKSTLIFCLEEQQGGNLRDKIRDASVLTAKHYFNHDLLIDALEEFTDGGYPVLLDNGLLPGDYDLPDVDLVILARPTGWDHFKRNMMERVLRLKEEKECMG